jgi:hypothetical protein
MSRKKAISKQRQPSPLPPAIRTGLWAVWGYGRAVDPPRKPAKIPVRVGEWGVPTFIGSDDPASWTDYDTAVENFEKVAITVTERRSDLVIWTKAGLGRLCSSDDELWVLDLDNCRADGKLIAAAEEVVERANTYTEVSPSGHGLRLAFTGSRPETLGLAEKGTVNGIAVESYDQLSTRFVSFTGNAVAPRGARVAKPSKKFVEWFGANWRKAPGHAQPATVETPTTAVLDALEAIALGKVEHAVFPILLDYTRVTNPITGEIDASEAFRMAVYTAAQNSSDLRVILASAIAATGDDRAYKGTRPVRTPDGRRRVPCAVYEVLRLTQKLAREKAAKERAKAALAACDAAALPACVQRLAREAPAALWQITFGALKRGLPPAKVAELTGQDPAAVLKVIEGAARLRERSDR